MKNRVGLLALASLMLVGSVGNLSAQWVPQSLTSLVQNTAQAATPEYDQTFGSNWQSIRIFRLLTPMDRPLRVYVNTSASPLYHPQYAQYVTEGMTMWSQALENRFSFVLIDNPQMADITVDWVDSFSDRYTAGLATYRIGDAKIRIKTVGVPDKDIKANIIHELGHALGIAGHSKDPNDIMVGVRRWRKGDVAYEPKLSVNDVSAIRRLYSNRWRKGEDLYVALQKENSTPSQNVNIAVSPVTENPSDSRVESYLSQLREKIDRNWAPSARRQGKPVIVRFQVDRQGHLADCTIRQSSGSGSVDSAALRVIRQTVSSMPLPQDYPAGQMSIEIALR